MIIMKIIDTSGTEHEYSVQDIYAGLKDHAKKDGLISLDYVMLGVFRNVPYREVFTLGDPKYISRKLVLPVGLLKDPESGKVAKQVLKITLENNNFEFIEPNVDAKSGNRFRHDISSTAKSHDAYRHKPHHRRSPKQYWTGRQLPGRISLCSGLIEEELKEINLSLDSIIVMRSEP